jgi:hypothetical protein
MGKSKEKSMGLPEKRAFQIYLNVATIEILREAAQKSRRSMSGYVEHLILLDAGGNPGVD